MEIRILRPGDEELLERFLRPRTETSMFLRGNLAAGGLDDHGEPLQGTYAAALVDGAVIAAAAHCWNGVVILQAPVALSDVVRAAVSATGRNVRGFAGPWDQATAAATALGLENAPTTLRSREDLFRLELAKLEVPSELADGTVICRRPREEELELVARWHVDYCQEALGAEDTPALHERCRSEMTRLQTGGIHWLLEHDGEPVSYSAFNTQLPECVQIGGVWTPPAWRGRGYARAVVAGSLIEARDRGAELSILFTGDDNEPASRAYEAIGYRVIGDYGLVDFADPRPYESPQERATP